jgi:hypothetical protein
MLSFVLNNKKKMAILLSTQLTGCNFIPGFIASGSRVIFENATSPTNWTKDDSFSVDGIALRVVTGTLNPGTTGQAFSQVLTQRSIGLSLTQVTAGVTLGTVSANIGFQPAQALSPFNTQPAIADIPQHTHTYPSNDIRTTDPGTRAMPGGFQTLSTTNAGQGGSHLHGVTVSAHVHGVQSPHTHTTTGQHSHTVSGPLSQENFSVVYRDFIISTKD